MKPKLFTLLLTAILVIATSQANASTIGYTGNIIRTLSDSSNFGGCMILLNTLPCGGWVSLDCKASVTPAGDGNRNFANALLAASLNKQVTVYVDTDKKVDTHYCVATRIDTIF